MKLKRTNWSPEHFHVAPSGLCNYALKVRFHTPRSRHLHGTCGLPLSLHHLHWTWLNTEERKEEDYGRSRDGKVGAGWPQCWRQPPEVGSLSDATYAFVACRDSFGRPVCGAIKKGKTQALLLQPVVKVITGWRTSWNAGDLDWTPLTSNSYFCFPKDHNFRAFQIRVNEGKQLGKQRETDACWVVLHPFFYAVVISGKKAHVMQKTCLIIWSFK